MKIKYLFITFSILISITTYSQQFIDQQTGNSIIQSYADRLPKFYNAYSKIKNERYFKQYEFIRGDGTGSPAFALENGTIRLDLSFIENEISDYDDNRLVVIIYHELGHLYYFKSHDPNNRSKQDNEKFAFEFSLKKTKEIAEQGDCQPLKTGIYFMNLRSQSNNLNDAHVKALKLIVTEPLFESYSNYADLCTEDNSNTLASSQTTLRLINNTSKEMYSAYAILDNECNCWVSRGWYKIGAYGSYDLDLGDYEGIVYTHSHQYGNKDKKWGDDKYFCINPTDAFEIYYAGKLNCETTVKFSSFRVTNGVNKYTFYN